MWGSKLGAVVLLAAVGVFGAYIPIVLRKCKIERFVCVLNTFAAGAFLGLALFHIMPEAAQTLEREEIYIYVGRFRTPFNIAFLLIFVGYVVILLCEQVLTPGEDSKSASSSKESEPATPRDVEDGGDAGWDREGQDGECGRCQKTDETQAKVAVMSAPLTAAINHESELGQNVRSPGTAALANSEETEGAESGGMTQSGLVPVVEGHETVLTTITARDMPIADEARSCSSSSTRRESLSGEIDTRGGGCGLGFPCCLMAAAAAREAARKQAGAGTGNCAATAIGRENTPECLEKCDVEEDILKEVKQKTFYAPPCCVLQQRQKHPRDSTRASAAGSDLDDTEYKDTTGVTETFDMKKTFRGDAMLKEELLSVVEALHQQDRIAYRLTGKDEQECEAAPEQTCARIDVRRPLSASADVQSLRMCGSSSNTTLHHPCEKRICRDCVSGASEEAAAAATKDTATADATCGDPGGMERTATPAGEREEERRRKRDSDVELVVRDIHLKNKFVRELRQSSHGDCKEGSREPKEYAHKWWGGLGRRRDSRRQLKKGKPPAQKKKKRGRFTFPYLCTSRFVCCSLPFSKHVNGGAFFLMAALAIHGLFEGFVVGAESNLVSLWIITSVIAAHKWAESLLLMTQFMERHLSATWSWVLMSIFVASSPLGIIIGACISNENHVAAGVCNALGAGTLFFVAAEVSTKVFTGERKHRLLQLLMYCAGAGMVFALNLLDIALESGPFSEEQSQT